MAAIADRAENESDYIIMKSEKDSTDRGFLANLRKNISELVAPSQAPTPASAGDEARSEATDAEVENEDRVNKVGKKIFELKVSEAAAIRPPLPGGFFYPDAQHSADLHAELLRQLPPGHPLAGVPMETFAARQGTDETLFRYRGNPRRFVLVQLTGAGQTETKDSPAIVWSGTFEEFSDYFGDSPT